MHSTDVAYYCKYLATVVLNTYQSFRKVSHFRVPYEHMRTVNDGLKGAKITHKSLLTREDSYYHRHKT